MSNSLNDLEKGDNESKDEEVTVKDIFEDDDDDEEAEIEILEYIDMVDEGYYTPSTLHLILLFCLVLLVSGGVGVLVYYAIEDRNEEESRSLPFPAPTVAPPTVPTEAPSGGFLCSICALGEVTLPDGVVDIVGQPKCSDLEAQGKTGAITEGQCGLLQAVTAEPCGCDQDAAKICTVCATGVVRDPDGVIDVSSAGFAGIDNVTCGQLDSFAQGGRIPVEFCPLLQEASVDTCKCGEGAATPDFCTVCSSGVVRNPAGILNVTAAGFPEIDTITCGALVTFEEARSIPIEFCPALQEASLEECDCGPEFVCSICGPSGIIRNPNGQIEFAGQTVTCANLEVITASGQIQESQCPGLQALASTPCDCGVAEGGQAILDLLSTVVGDAVYASNTSEYLAAQFLISEDPRYNQVRRRMEPLTLLQEEYPSGSNGTSVPELPPAGPEAQSNITEDLFPVTISVPDASTNSTDDAVAFDANVTMSDDPNERPDNTETNTTVTSSVIPLSDMEDSAIIQRYLLILLYFQTTENRASPWMTSCAAAGATQTRRGLQDLSECTFRNNETAAKWLSEALECEWAGVSCSPATGEVVALQLSKFVVDKT